MLEPPPLPPDAGMVGVGVVEEEVQDGVEELPKKGDGLGDGEAEDAITCLV